MTDTTDPNAQPAHSPIGASSMSRLIACPASLLLGQQALKGARRSSIYAATGTVAHALAEEAIFLGEDPALQMGQTVTVDGYDITVDEDMVQGVRIYTDEVKRRFTGADMTGLEERVVLDEYWAAGEKPAHVSAFGTADGWAYHKTERHLDVIDYKNGAGVFVDVTDNPQLLYYGAGVLLRLEQAGRRVATLDLTVVQPNFRGKAKVRTHRTSSVDVVMWVNDVLKPTVKEALSPGARIAAGDHCRFCPAKASCPALAQVRQDLARRDFGPVLTGLEVLDPTELGSVLSDYGLVDPQLSALRERAITDIQSGTSVPGWAVVPSRPVRGWAVNAGTLAEALILGEDPAIASALGLLTDSKLRTPAQLEKLLTPEQWAVLAPYVQSKSSGVRLVPDGDAASGNSGRSTAQDDFA